MAEVEREEGTTDEVSFEEGVHGNAVMRDMVRGGLSPCLELQLQILSPRRLQIPQRRYRGNKRCVHQKQERCLMHHSKALAPWWDWLGAAWEAALGRAPAWQFPPACHLAVPDLFYLWFGPVSVAW